MGGEQRIIRTIPASVQLYLPSAPSLNDEATFRLVSVEPAQRSPVAAASATFTVPGSTLYRWLARSSPEDLTNLEPRSRRPKQTRRHQWTEAQEQGVLALRQQHPRYDKLKLHQLLKAQGITPGAAMIGRILTSLRRRKLLRAPHGCASVGNGPPARMRPACPRTSGSPPNRGS